MLLVMLAKVDSYRLKKNHLSQRENLEGCACDTGSGMENILPTNKENRGESRERRELIENVSLGRVPLREKKKKVSDQKGVQNQVALFSDLGT